MLYAGGGKTYVTLVKLQRLGLSVCVNSW